jgi:hypothetical protein
MSDLITYSTPLKKFSFSGVFVKLTISRLQ